MKKKSIIVGLVIFVLAVGAIGLIVVDRLNQPTKQPSEVVTMTSQEQVMHDVTVSLLNTDDPATSDEALQRALAAATTDEERATVYRDRAANLLQDGNVSDERKRQSLEDARAAYALHQDAAAARMVAAAAASLGDQALADEYTTIADAFIDTESEESRGR